MYLKAQDPFIKLNRTKFSQHDTLTFSCNINKYKTDSFHLATLNVWVENIEDKRSWKFRYPLIDGETGGTIIIDSAISSGKYAFNFVVQKQFFSLEGSIINYTKDKKNIRYTLITKDQQYFSFPNFLPSADGSFRLKGSLFEDTATFIFSPSVKNSENNLIIKIRSPLDSSFIPDTLCTQIITIGNSSIKEENYHFNYDGFYKRTTLPDVIVTTKAKTKIELFDGKYSNGLFKNNDNSIIFDGIEDDRIAHSINVLEFLNGRVGGLQIIPKSNGNYIENTYILQWRGASTIQLDLSNVDLFLNEMPINVSDAIAINTVDIAMIKAIPPPAFLSAGGNRAAIAIYTKHGDEDIEGKGKYTFKIFGYTAPEIIWEKK